MAAVTVGTTSKTATLSAGVADTITFTQTGPVACEVLNLDSSAMIWMRTDGVAATVAGDDCVPIPASSTFLLNGSTTISLISSGGPQYTVNRLV